MPPANDAFANAQLISGAGGTVAGDNTAATREVGEPVVGDVSSITVWYQWVCPSDVLGVRFDTLSTVPGTWTGASPTPDTTLGLFTGAAVGALATIATADDFAPPTEYRSVLTATVVPGTTYHVQVAGYDSGEFGPFILRWAVTAWVPTPGKRIVARVYDRAAPGVPLGALSEDANRTWTHVLNGEGSGSVTVPNLGADAALLDCDSIIRFALDGTDRFAILSPKRNHHTIAPRQSEETLTVSGPGVLALLHSGLIYPETGKGEPGPTERLFNFAARRGFDDSAWIAATEIKEQFLSTGQWDNSPALWPDPHAFWIWAQAQGMGTPPQPIGECFFRTTFTLATEIDGAFFVTADDGYELYLDGQLISAATEAFMWGRFNRIDRFVKAGTHQLAIKGININRPTNNATNVAGVIMTLYETTNGGRVLADTPVVHTDNSWLCVAYPSEPPTMTPGLILRVLLEEAQARGDVAGVTWDFTDADDSGGNPWDTVDLSFGIGRSILELIRSLTSYLIDVSMSPALVLSAWNQGGLGTDLSGSVQLDTSNLSDLVHDGECPLLTVALTQLPNGTWVETQNTMAIAQHGWQEGYLALATAPSEAQIGRLTRAAFFRYGHENDETTMTIEPKPGATPYTDFAPVGDTLDVLASDRTTLLPTRIETLRVSEDRGGNPIYVATGEQVAEAVGS